MRMQTIERAKHIDLQNVNPYYFRIHYILLSLSFFFMIFLFFRIYSLKFISNYGAKNHLMKCRERINLENSIVIATTPSPRQKWTAHILRHIHFNLKHIIPVHNNTDTLTHSNEKHIHYTQTHSLSYDLFCTCFVSLYLSLSSMVEIHVLKNNLANGEKKNDHSTENGVKWVANIVWRSLSHSVTLSIWLWLTLFVIESLGESLVHSCAQPLKLMHGIRPHSVVLRWWWRGLLRLLFWCEFD